MKTAFRRSFSQDLKNIKNKTLLKRIQRVIEKAEAAEQLTDISNLKKMSGADHFYRVRVGDYRIGVFVENDIVEFVRCLHRRELYRFFP